ncbi:6-phosphogluconolactonase [Alisedimentitalea sp. MJ-SS2]|uniref:6-phosphogluconolactonase n=1 Tax=Aliisedimentitalea sp. MJ-SS2 TaxID=3049795 RepID=UPI0029093419|nr:6-phosphogluconolactonase [Alisedimentitalea sp. MJ-SS2]MDU8929797.1 6-phosphogluconolactonase [Alisedimentitalea sp. MJ-SS2]
MKLIEYADAEMMALDLANTIAGELESVLMGGGRATLVVAGGTTPGPVFDSLSGADLDWPRVDVALSDERWLPEVNLRSNARLIKERLLVGRAAEARFHPLFVPADDPEEVLAEIESGLIPCLPISVLLLGMGVDMHTASLFPGGDNLATALAPDAPILIPIRADGAPEPRVSMSARVLNAALSKHLMITGTAKRNALEKAQNLPASEAPVSSVLSDCTVHWSP